VTAPAPPRLAVHLLETFLPEDQREAVIGDLAEAFEVQAADHPIRARIDFWRETIAAVTGLQSAPADVAAYTPCSRESLMQSFVADIRRAVRSLARARAFAALCILTLALAIGATTAILSVANPLLLNVVPYPDADRLVVVNERMGDGSPANLGYATYRDLRSSSRSLAHSAAFGTWEPTIFGERDAERLRGLRVSWEFFRTLGVRPALGRDFLPEDDTPDTYNVVILSHALWTQRFGGDSAIIGRPMDLGVTKPIVVGVLPASFEDVIDPTSRIYRVLGYAEQGWACRSCRHLRMVGRLGGGATVAGASLELNALMQRLAGENPTVYPGAGAVVEKLSDRVTRNTRAIFVVTIGAVVVLLLIAIANVVNLQLARAARREEEFAVRAALGAGRGRIARQLLAEGLVISTVAGALGVVAAVAILPSIVAGLPQSLPRLGAVTLDWQVLGVVVGVLLLVALALGMFPAMQAGRRGLFEALRSGGRGGSGMHHRTRSALVVAEVALAMMLLVGAALLGQSLVKLLDVELGFDPSQLVTMQVQASGPRYDSAQRIFANHDAIRMAVSAVPGVTAVGLVSELPLGGGFDQYGITDRERPDTPLGEADRYAVSADYMRAMRIAVVQGRAFTEAESRDTVSRVAIVSQSLARRMWPGGNAVGRFIRIGGGDGRPWFEVVGIAADTRHTGIDELVSQQVYTLERQWQWPQDVMTLVARVEGDPHAAMGAIHAAVRSVDPLQPITRIATMEQVVARSTGQRRLGATMFVAFGVLALLLAAAGIYGVLSGAVAARTREIGVRAALGATPARISALVLRQAGVLVVAGLVVGAASALALSRYLQALLFSVQPSDPLALIVAAVVVGAAALLASAPPMLRASSVDPVEALRGE
jgi:putative ABC transport system permease protein